jgi:hypothetical protein
MRRMNYRQSARSCRVGGRLFAVALVLFSSLLPGVLPAAEIEGLYQATVPVVSREDERERQQAFATALRQVLVKLSGRTDTLENPDIRRALAGVQGYVEAWAYRSQEAVAGDPALAPASATPVIILEVSFFQRQLQELLDSAGIALWPRNRPETLVWIVEQNAAGERRLLGADSTEYAALQTHAAERAMPLISPILDLEDRLALRPDQLWELDPAVILAASARYRADSVLVLRIMHLVSGDVIARAEHHLGGLVSEADALEAPLEPFLADSIDLAARELASNYGVFASRVQDSGTQVSLSVAGIDSIADYAGVLRYLEALAVVQGVQVSRAEGSTLVLNVSAGGQLRQLIETLALDRRMLPLGDPVREGQAFNLSYQWQGL